MKKVKSLSQLSVLTSHLSKKSKDILSLEQNKLVLDYIKNNFANTNPLCLLSDLKLLLSSIFIVSDDVKEAIITIFIDILLLQHNLRIDSNSTIQSLKQQYLSVDLLKDAVKTNKEEFFKISENFLQKLNSQKTILGPFLLDKFHKKIIQINDENFHNFSIEDLLLHLINKFIPNMTQGKVKIQIVKNSYRKCLSTDYVLNEFCSVTPLRYPWADKIFKKINIMVKNSVDLLGFINFNNEKKYLSFYSFVETIIIEETKMNKYSLKIFFIYVFSLYSNNFSFVFDEVWLCVFIVTQCLLGLHGVEFVETKLLSLCFRNIKESGELTNRDLNIFLRKYGYLDNVPLYMRKEVVEVCRELYNLKEENKWFKRFYDICLVYCSGNMDKRTTMLLYALNREDVCHPSLFFMLISRL